MVELDFQGTDWISELPRYQTNVIRELLANGQGEEQVAALWLEKVGANTTVGFSANGVLQNFYGNVKAEFVKLICGDAQYEKERAEVVSIWEKQGKLTVVSTVAAFVGAQVGLAAVALVPVIALLFSIIAKVGIGAFCATCAHPTSTP